MHGNIKIDAKLGSTAALADEPLLFKAFLLEVISSTKMCKPILIVVIK